MGRARGMYEGGQKYIRMFGVEKWRDDLEYVGVDERIILKLFLKIRWYGVE